MSEIETKLDTWRMQTEQEKARNAAVMDFLLERMKQGLSPAEAAYKANLAGHRDVFGELFTVIDVERCFEELLERFREEPK